MTGSFNVTEPIPALTAELSDKLREQVEKTLIYLIKTNRHTRYVRESPVFSDFRGALDVLGDTNDDMLQDALLRESFRTTVPFTGYDSYEPFMNMLVTPNPREKDVKDMFSPGLPYFVASSSATSGKKAKLFAKYRHATESSYQHVNNHANPISAQGGKNCIVYSLTYQEVIKVIDDDSTTVGQFPITCMSSGVIRMRYDTDVGKDPFLMTITGIVPSLFNSPVSDTHTFSVAPRATSPVAVSFIVNYRSFLLMHILFALADPQLETINTLFGPVFIDMIRCMEEEWDALVYSVETGVLPDWEGTNHVRQYLEVKVELFAKICVFTSPPAKIFGETGARRPSSRRRKSNGSTWVAQKVMARAQCGHWYCEWCIFICHSKGMRSHLTLANTQPSL